MPRRQLLWDVYTREKVPIQKNWELKQGWEKVLAQRGHFFGSIQYIDIFFLPQSNSSTKNFSSSASVAVPARSKQLVPDESGILKKELNKAYERIAALEGRNQELTLQTTGVRM